MITPVAIAVGERYAQLATISIPSFLKYNNCPVYIVADELAKKALSDINNPNLKFVDEAEYVNLAKQKISIKDFITFDYMTNPYTETLLRRLGYTKFSNDKHYRVYSSINVLIMDAVVEKNCPESQYVLNLDVDALFTGDIMSRINQHLEKYKHQYDAYMVERKDDRMLQTKSQMPGSGFTLWKRNGKFIDFFIKNFNKFYAENGGQALIYKAVQSINGKVIDDPLLHFVSPDLKNPNITDAEIKQLKPAYIHLHGVNSYERLLRFKKVFDG